MAEADVPSRVTLLENGRQVEAQGGPEKRPLGVVFVIDISASTDASGVLAEARRAVKPFVASLRQGTQFAVVAAGADALLVQRFTTDTALVDRAMTGDTAGAAAYGRAPRANSRSRRQQQVGTIVMIPDGNNGRRVFSSAAARSRLRCRGYVVDHSGSS